MLSDSHPLVSFVVLSYNFSRFLGDCVQSILNQEGGCDFEIILVDDASTDDTTALLSTLTDPRIRIIHHERNLGHAATVADGIRSAKGTYIARIDGDDRYRPAFLRNVLDIFHRFPEVGLVYGDAALMNDRGEITAEHSDRVHGDRDFKGNELVSLLEQNFICAPTIIARAKAWQKALPVPQGLAFHDWYFTLSIAREHEFYYVNHVLADYRVHVGNLHTSIARNKSEEASIFWLLERIYCESEKTYELEIQKRGARRRVYGAHYLTLADKYFGFQMDGDARRCYLQAVRYQPRYLSRPDVMRRLLGTYIGRKGYEFSKSIVKAAISPRGGTRG